MSANRSSNKLLAVTPDMLNNDFTVIPRAVRVGTPGDLVIIDSKGVTTTIPNCLQGEYVPVEPTQILSSSSADDLVLFF